MTRRRLLDVAVVVIPFALGVRPAGGQEAEDGGVASGAMIRFLWQEPQGLTSAPYPPGTTGVGTPDLALPGAPPRAGQPLWLGIFISNWGPQGDLQTWQCTLDSRNLPAGLSVFRMFCFDDQVCSDLLGEDSDCFRGPVDLGYWPAFQQRSRPDFEQFQSCACRIATDDLSCRCTVGESESLHPDPGSERNGATFILAAYDRLDLGPHTIEFLEALMEGPGGIDLVVKAIPATITIRTGSCCFDIGVASTTPCASDVTFTECQDLNAGPFPPVFRDGKPCPDEGGTPCPLGVGSCCNSQAGPLAEAGICNNLTPFSDCQCSTCTFFLNEACEDVIADGLCEADVVAIPTVSEWGLVITTLLLLIGSKILWRERATKLLLGDPHSLRREK